MREQVEQTKNTVPIHQKLNLTLKEAAEYSNIYVLSFYTSKLIKLFPK